MEASLLHSRFKSRHATLLLCGEERCVTTLKTAVYADYVEAGSFMHQSMKKCMHKIRNMSLQTSLIFPVLDRWANLLSFPVKSSVWLYADRKPRACQKLGKGPGVGKCPAPGQHKICKCPTPGTDKAGKCPAVAWGGGGLGAAGIDWCITDHVRLILLYYLRACAKKCFVSFRTRNLVVSFRLYFHKMIFIHHCMTEYRMISQTAIQDKCQFCSHKRQLLNIEPRQKT